MRQFIEDKAKEAGVIGAEDMHKHFDSLKADVDESMSPEELRAAKVKNISLRLLNVEKP